MRTERVTATVQTIRDALLCALQLHQDREGIRGADVDLHRRLIQQVGCGALEAFVKVLGAHSIYSTLYLLMSKKGVAEVCACRANDGCSESRDVRVKSQKYNLYHKDGDLEGSL